ncbi:hypothetical protein U9M48_021943 [Paspalum notatum var. saurae]|uniref:Uncharacterized protein n=1 Tax=Paspalum notatum var. saurae TaxID=547442 RepID=A0AAQ3TKT6_PASNO
MLRLRSHLVLAVRGASALPAASSLHSLLYSSSTATATTPAGQFVVEDYLTISCGLTPAQARKASRYLPSLKSPNNPDTVRAFLAGIGVSKADVTAAVARDAWILCCNVNKTLAPHVAQLRDVGLSPPQISRLISVVPTILYRSLWITRLAFYLSLLGSYDKVHTVLRGSMYVLGYSLESVVKPNMVFLRQSGLTDSDMAKLFLLAPYTFMLDPRRAKEVVLCADMLGVPRDSAMFKHALAAFCCMSPEKITARSDFLKKVLGCSEAEIRVALCKLPGVLLSSEDRMGRVVDFLKMEVGLEPNYIVRRPALLKYSLTKRLMPRHYVLKALKAEGLVKEDVDFFTANCYTEKGFKKRFLDPYIESVQGVADAYDAACAGQVVPVINNDSLK